MGFLDAMNNISAATSAASGVGSLLFGQRMSRANARYQMKLQKELMATQQSYAVQNAATDYARQRELMRDTSLLSKYGRQQAGLSTAGDYNNVSATPPQISAPSAPAAPAMLDPSVRMLQGASSLQASVSSLFDNKLKESKKANMDSLTERQNIENAFAIDKEIAEVYKMQKEGEISDAEAQTRLENLKRLRATSDDYIEQQHEATSQAQLETQRKELEVKQETIKADILSVTKQLSDEQLKQARFITEHQFEQYSLQLKETLSRIKLNEASSRAALASAAASAAQAMYTNIQSKLEAAKIPYADKLAKSISDSAANAAKASSFDLVGHEREAKYQRYAMSNEDNGIVGDFLKSVKQVFDNSLGAISLSGKLK